MHVIFAGPATQNVNKQVLNTSLKQEGQLEGIVGKRKLTADTVTAVKQIKSCCKEVVMGSKENEELKMQQGR